jgi:hypothetical protein
MATVVSKVLPPKLTYPRPPRPPDSEYYFWVWCEDCLQWELTGRVGARSPDYANMLLWEAETRSPLVDGCIHIYQAPYVAELKGTLRMKAAQTDASKYRVIRRAR